MTGRRVAVALGLTAALVSLGAAPVGAARSSAFLREEGSVSGSVGVPSRIGAATSDPATAGSWSVLGYSSPVKVVHAAVLHNGTVLLGAGSGNNGGSFAAGSFKTSVWNPGTGTFTSVPTPWDLFCAGHALLPDGRVLIAGGTSAYPTATTPFKGSRRGYLFDPATNTYTRVGDMKVGRWYPTVVSLGNGDLLTVAGKDVNGSSNTVTEVFHAGAWAYRADLPQKWPLYPDLTLLATGKLFYSGISGWAQSRNPGIWNLATNSWQNVYGLTNRQSRFEGATVLLPPAQDQRVMVLGGGVVNGGAVADTNIVDLKAATPAYTAGPPVPAAKQHVTAVVLPDSTVLQTGGGARYRAAPVLDASIYDPKTNRMTVVAPPAVARLYHSEGFLLPDGRVAMLGSNPLDESFETRIEVYSPPYLFKGTRPAITAAPTEVRYGARYGVSTTQAQPIASMVLIRPSSVTHQLDPDQRLVALQFAQTSTGVTVTLPASGNLAPPGWYMLFAVDASGVPSVASWVHLA